MKTDVIKHIRETGVIPVVRATTADEAMRAIDAIREGGISVLEITMTVPGAVELIRQTARTLPAGFVMGAGTVCDEETVRRVVDAGARFIVSPVMRPAVIKAAHAAGVPAFPGCFSPTEILEAWDLGAEIIKVFPATALGPGYLKDVHGPLPQVKLMPTGGVTIDNAGDWIRAGACGVGVGSALLAPKAIAAGDYAALTDGAKRIMANVDAARKGR